MTVELDELDMRIIELMRRDARRSYQSIGKELGVSEGTVRKRVKRLVGAGVIKRFTVDVERPQQVLAISMVSVDPSVPTPVVAEKLAALRGVERVYEVTGQYDALVIISLDSVSELNRCIEDIRKIQGVRDTNTAMVLRVVNPSR
ncbi:MAG: Lrp/AsnC family transcriptional regulator [Nitrososphaerota archaeon]|nr:Lrp/AsnC family transcriptional regulator [Candidatus Calditenuaceae archaeon]MDW8073536.1 Lrp/AsnC family transcriptional regulator [Nitrososphaerota archaeon]